MWLEPWFSGLWLQEEWGVLHVIGEMSQLICGLLSSGLRIRGASPPSSLFLLPVFPLSAMILTSEPSLRCEDTEPPEVIVNKFSLLSSLRRYFLSITESYLLFTLIVSSWEALKILFRLFWNLYHTDALYLSNRTTEPQKLPLFWAWMFASPDKSQHPFPEVFSHRTRILLF